MLISFGLDLDFLNLPLRHDTFRWSNLTLRIFMCTNSGEWKRYRLEYSRTSLLLYRKRKAEVSITCSLLHGTALSVARTLSGQWRGIWLRLYTLNPTRGKYTSIIDVTASMISCRVVSMIFIILEGMSCQAGWAL